MEELRPPSYARTAQVITTRVMSESRRAYGAIVDDLTLQDWVTAILESLMNEQTRVTTFVPLLAMRDIRILVEQYQLASVDAA